MYMALNRSVNRQELRRIRKGIYYKGVATPYGMSGPGLLTLGLVVAGSGSGPAGLTATNFLGFTTQVPNRVEIAVPGRPPVAPEGIRFTARPARRLVFHLNPYETAVLEALRIWPRGFEVDVDGFGQTIALLADDGAVSLDKIGRAVAGESVPAARELWHRLVVQMAS